VNFKGEFLQVYNILNAIDHGLIINEVKILYEVIVTEIRLELCVFVSFGGFCVCICPNITEYFACCSQCCPDYEQ
jgi:hypothetical protein